MPLGALLNVVSERGVSISSLKTCSKLSATADINRVLKRHSILVTKDFAAQSIGNFSVTLSWPQDA